MNIFVLFIGLIGSTIAIHLGATEGILGSIRVTLATLMVSFFANVWHHMQQFDANHRDKRSRFWHGVVFTAHASLYLASYLTYPLFRDQLTGVDYWKLTHSGWLHLLYRVGISLGCILVAIIITAEISMYFERRRYDRKYGYVGNGSGPDSGHQKRDRIILDRLESERKQSRR